MKKTLLKQLVLNSYVKGELNQENVFAIADRLDRKELKQYSKALKQSEKLHSVIIEVPFYNDKDNTDALKELFPDKKLIIRKNPSLISGLRIRMNDDIFEMNLKHNLDAIVSHVTEEYD